MNWIDDYFLPYITFVGFTFNESVMDFVADKFGEYAAFVVMVLMLPLTLILIPAGMALTGVAMILAVVLSPIILPIAIYRHRAK